LQLIAVAELIREAFIENLPELDWMDAQTMASAVEKAEKMVVKMGYPDFIKDRTLLDEYYVDVSVYYKG
jgi:predicted metalloendopeptidase